jgi:hypothetical protein
MKAYPTRATASNPVVSFSLHVQQPHTTGDLDAWVTRALATVKPWVWTLRARLSRTWKRNPHYENGAHAIERRAREEELRRDLDAHARLRGGMAAHRLPGAYGLRAKAVLHALARLVEGGDWWKPRQLVNRATGEITGTVYLPEDTWSAQTALHWCIERLGILARAAGGMTERVTPPSSRREPVTSSERRKTALRDGITEADLVRIREKYGGEQPELPATT